MIHIKKIIAAGLLTLACQLVWAHPHHNDNIESNAGVLSHAPIGVMRDHVHKKGECMVSYRYAYGFMEGSRAGDSRVSVDEVLQTYRIAPTNMRMQMQTLGIMYGATDKVTVMLMVPFKVLMMDHVTRSGMSFTTRERGLADVSLSILSPLYDNGKESIVAALGLVAPTGDITPRDATPMGANSLLPYPMRLGGGTWNLTPALTWVKHYHFCTVGSQAGANLTLGRNSRDYALGDGVHVTAWAVKKWGDSWANSLRINWQYQRNITGADPRLAMLRNNNIIYTADPNQRRVSRIDLLFGLQFYGKLPKCLGGKFITGKHRFAVEFGVPVYQNLAGTQLEFDWSIKAGWQISW